MKIEKMADGTFKVEDDNGNKAYYDDVRQNWPLNVGYKVAREGKVGFLNGRGRLVVECKYDNVECIELGARFRVTLNGKQGIVDNKNVEIVPCENDRVACSGEIFQCEKDGEFRVVDIVGIENKLTESVATTPLEALQSDFRFSANVPRDYDKIDYQFGSPAFVVQKGKKLGAVDMKNNEIVPCRYQNVQVVPCDISGDNFYVVVQEPDAQLFKKKPGKFGLYSKYGSQVLDCQYEEIEILPETNLVSVRLNGKYGLYDLVSGKFVVECKEAFKIDLEKLFDLAESDVGLIDYLPKNFELEKNYISLARCYERKSIIPTSNEEQYSDEELKEMRQEYRVANTKLMSRLYAFNSTLFEADLKGKMESAKREVYYGLNNERERRYLQAQMAATLGNIIEASIAARDKGKISKQEFRNLMDEVSELSNKKFPFDENGCPYIDESCKMRLREILNYLNNLEGEKK